MLQYILTIDKNITIWIYHSIPRFFLNDWASQLLNIFIIPFLLWIFVLIIFHYQKKRYLFILFPLFNFLITGGISNYILKNMFLRLRPCIIDIVTRFSCPSDFSFPSSHTATSFAAATTIAFIDPKRKNIYYSLALLISISRLYLGVHYFFDVIGGIVIGVTVALLSLKIIRYNQTYKV